jgi:acyl dehydratase
MTEATEFKFKPRGLYFEEFEVGVPHVTARRTITEADVVTFAGVSGDFNPLHTDEEFGKASPAGGRIAHGVLTLAVATGLTNQLAIYEGTTIALTELTVRFTGMVKFGDTVHVVLTPKEKREHKKPDRGIVIFDLDVRNQRGETVLAGSWTTLLRRRSPAVA